MTTPSRTPTTVGFLERRRRTGAVLTLLVLILVGAAVGGAVGMGLTRLVHLLLDVVAA